MVNGRFEELVFCLLIQPDQLEILDDLIESPVNFTEIGIACFLSELDRRILVSKCIDQFQQVPPDSYEIEEKEEGFDHQEQ